MPKTEQTDVPPVPPPDDLAPVSQSLWRDLAPRCRTLARQEMLRQALLARDLADTATEELLRCGVTSTSPKSGVIHVHPLTRVARESRAQFFAGLNLLGLTGERTPGIYSVK